MAPARGRALAKVLGVAATALAVAALANHAVARRSERRHPPCGSFIEVDGVRLHYVDRGEGVPVVLLHGNGGMIEDFEISGVLDAVARKHRVIVFDRPGFGYSERPRSTAWTAAAQAELLHQALGQLGVRRPVLVGHSWGTLVALSMALEHQAETGALVLLSGYYTPSLRLDVPLLAGPAIPVLGDLMRYTISPLLGWLLAPMVFRKIFAPAPVTSRFAAGFPTGLALRPWQIRASAADTALMIPAAASMLGRRGELTIPVVIVAGSEDKLVDTEVQSRGLHDDVAHSEMREVPGAGHMIHHTAPGEVVAAIDVAVRASMSAEAPGEVWPGHEAS